MSVPIEEVYSLMLIVSSEWRAQKPFLVLKKKKKRKLNIWPFQGVGGDIIRKFSKETLKTECKKVTIHVSCACIITLQRAQESSRLDHPILSIEFQYELSRIDRIVSRYSKKNWQLPCLKSCIWLTLHLWDTRQNYRSVWSRFCLHIYKSNLWETNKQPCVALHVDPGYRLQIDGHHQATRDSKTPYVPCFWNTLTEVYISFFSFFLQCHYSMTN